MVLNQRVTYDEVNFFCANLLGDPLSHGSPVVLSFGCGHPRFWNFYSTIPVDVVGVKSYVNCLFDPALVVIRVAVSEHAYNTGHKPL